MDLINITARRITEEIVERACEDLKRNGEHVTVRAVWERIGGGSPYLIRRIVIAWKNRQPRVGG